MSDPPFSDALPSFEETAGLIRARRTSMLVDRQRPVDAALVEELCDLATWAPNHRKTWPWRFAYFTGEGRRRFGETMVADMIDAGFGDEGKREKTGTKYLRTPGTLVVGCAPHDNEMLHAENRDAVAAGIQNFLLGATARGLATFWSTPALTNPPRTLELCGFGPGDRIVGVIYLGWPVGEPATPERPGVRVEVIAD
jgi:nitroreductase